MKKFLAMAAVAALAAGASAYAANPFADVSTSDWAYQAVSDLSAQGIVEGYPDGTFKGQTNITRYEMAQIVARLMAKEDQYNAEQRATIDKLAGEYADELDSLGVKVSNLEKKVGNISWSGDARIRYQRGLNHIKHPLVGVLSINDEHQDQYDGRLRLNLEGTVNDQVTVKGRFLTEFDFQDGQSADTQMDRLHVVYTPNERTSIDIGRTDLWLGQTGILYDDAFDGIKASYGAEHFNIEAGYGRMISIDPLPLMFLATNENGKVDKSELESYYVQAKAKTGAVQFNAFYLKLVQDSNSLKDQLQYGIQSDTDFQLWGVGSSIRIRDKWVLDGDYIKNPGSYMTNFRTYSANKPTLWTVGITYGTVDTDKPGSYSIGLRYVDADPFTYLGGSTLDMTDYLAASWFSGAGSYVDKWGNKAYGSAKGAKFWFIKAGIAVAKNVELDAYYYFNAKVKEITNSNSTTENFDDIYGIELNYTF